jgi:DNA-binding winged helix-turn-helix (wHTH) protein
VRTGFRFGRFLLDTGARQLLRDGSDVHLSPKAFQLLELLVAKRPDAVSKAHIQDVLWPDTHVVEANVANLAGEIRAALEEDRHGPRYIRTVPRFGYAFACDDVDSADAPSPFMLVRGERGCRLRIGINELGRSKEHDALFDAPTVSRRHARIVVTGASALIEDLGSKNGTFVGGTRVVGSAPLHDGDVVRLGSAVATFCRDVTDRSTISLSNV